MIERHCFTCTHWTPDDRTERWDATYRGYRWTASPGGTCRRFPQTIAKHHADHCGEWSEVHLLSYRLLDPPAVPESRP